MTAPRNAAPPEHHFRGQTAGLETGLANSTIPRPRRGVTLSDWDITSIRRELSRKKTATLLKELEDFRTLPPVVRSGVWHYAVALGLECADRALALEACEQDGGAA